MSSSTTYEAIEECGATTVAASVCTAQGVEVSEGQVCCETTTTVNGIQDSCSTTHHAKYKNNASLTAANSANTPTLQTAL